MRLPRLFFVLALAAPLAAAPAFAQSAPATGARGPAAQVGPGARVAPGAPGMRDPSLRGGPGGRHGGPGMRGHGPGAGAGHEVLTPDQRFERRYQHIVGSLGLDQAQAAQVRTILTEGRAQHEALASQRLTGEDARTRHRQLMEANGQRIRALLRPDQQRAFDFHAQRLREMGDRFEGRGEHGPGGPGRGHGGGGMMGRVGGHIRQMLDSLGLDDAQRTAVRQIMQEGRAQHEAVRDQALTGEERRARHRQIMEANGQRIRTLLRADQQRLFDARVAEMRARFEAFRSGAGAPGAAPVTPPAGAAPSGI